MLTWLVKGRLNEFVKYRSLPPPPGLHTSSAASIRSTRSAKSFLSYRSGSGRSSSRASGSTGGSTSSGERTDTAYAANIADGKLELWISELRDESLRKLDDPKTLAAAAASRAQGQVGEEAVWVNGVPELLRLVRGMLSADADMRPTAKAVRDQVEEVLATGCCFQTLCCRGREWESGKAEDVKRGRGKDRKGGGAEEEVASSNGNGNSGGSSAEVESRHVRSRRIDEAIETKRSGGVPIRKRKVSLPWRRK